jgi:hypothetical protein
VNTVVHQNTLCSVACNKLELRFQEAQIQFYRTDCHKGSDSEDVFCGVCIWYSVKNNCKWKDGCETGNGRLKCF